MYDVAVVRYLDGSVVVYGPRRDDPGRTWWPVMASYRRGAKEWARGLVKTFGYDVGRTATFIDIQELLDRSDAEMAKWEDSGG